MAIERLVYRQSLTQLGGAIGELDAGRALTVARHDRQAGCGLESPD